MARYWIYGCKMTSDVLSEFNHTLATDRVITSGAELDKACVDYFGHFQGNAVALLYPTNTDEVADVLSICAKHKISITVQGGKTGLVGGSVPPTNNSNVIINLSHLNKIRELDVQNRSVVVEAGVTIAELNTHLAASNLQFPISIGSDSECQIGGVLSTNAGGHNVLRYGMARHQLLGIEAVLPNTQIISELNALRKDNVGYDFGQLLCGAEGTLGVITAAALKLVPVPRLRTTALLAIDNISDVIALYDELSFELSDVLSAFELIADTGRQMVELNLPAGSPPPIVQSQWYVLLETQTSATGIPLEQIVATSLAPALETGILTDAVVAQNETQRAQLWKFRETIVFAQSKHGPTLPHDLSVRVSKIPELVMLGKKAVSSIIDNVSFMIFGHVGDGNIHFNVVHNGPNPEFKDKYSDAIEQALCEIVQKLHGSISAEHGIGKKKKHLVKYSRNDDAVELMKSTRRSLDPNLLLNKHVLF